ncbi:MAG TPA: homoserine dehydrogenase [Anaerohalosphaeraceae bacterium]|jgi:homoserine dehydrogenase|nr:homoserine dehydrogenase [Anaerohalosphaeraceae bacterium]HRT51376.1 homoserine dehydrogenase [Anaerohalosphaeraceae bacterium]HRT87309.1 homoserine dehydrogenase [Anaerohalosphaeraceae bacterium]
MSYTKTRVGLVGFGTVGAGVADLLLNNADIIRAKTGMDIELATVIDLDTKRPRPVELPAGLLTDNLDTLLADKTIDIGIELVGGTSFARDLHLKMLAAGKHVVTANKALLAEHGAELFAAARKAGKCIAFEASCAGGIPIISAIRSGLAANRIDSLYGILNGTCNYILTNMTQKGLDFRTALSQAQAKGYAEADPTLDINGSDSAHKLAILAGLAFGCEIKLSDIYVEGIEGISIDDIRYGQEMGYVLKLLAIAERDAAGRISLRVAPSFVHRENALARVDGPFNAISVFAHAVGHTMYYGRGAGMMPTASAVVADIIEVAMGNSLRVFNGLALLPRAQTEPLISDMDDLEGRFYIRLMAKDQPGVFATYGRILGDNQISISGALQHEGSGPDNTVPVVITTHPTKQKNMAAALVELGQLDVVSGNVVCIRIVDIPEDRDA